MRHGRTAWNVDKRFQGHTDVALDEGGRAQARALAAFLRGERFDAAVTSDLSRARETAETIAAPHALAVESDARWREMQFGAWEGLTWPQIVARFPEIEAGKYGLPKFVTPRNGESFEQLCARVGSALASLREGWGAGGRVLVVTHAGPLHALLHVALGNDEAQALAVRFTPAGITRLRVGDSGAALVSLNETLPGSEVI